MVMLAAFAPVCADAQVSTLKIIGTACLPVPFAFVSIDGGTPSITNGKANSASAKSGSRPAASRRRDSFSGGDCISERSRRVLHERADRWRPRLPARRRDGMPDDVLKAYEGCGVIVIWTGRR
jgi:hypothetical protein